MNDTSTFSNAQILLTLEHLLNDMENKGAWTLMEATVNSHLKQAWQALSNDPEVQAVFK